MKNWTKAKIRFGVDGLISLVIFGLINVGVYSIGGTGWMLVSLGVTAFYGLSYVFVLVVWYFMAREAFKD